MAPLALISDGNGLIVMTVIFDVLIIASIALRLKARFLTKAGLKSDDWLAVVALVCALHDESCIAQSFKASNMR